MCAFGLKMSRIMILISTICKREKTHYCLSALVQAGGNVNDFTWKHCEHKTVNNSREKNDETVNNAGVFVSLVLSSLN